MATLPPTFRSTASQRIKREAKARFDAARTSASERGYDWRWRQASLAFRQQNPLCAYSALDGVTAASEVVDHLYPHGGNYEIFWMSRYWIACSKAMHDSFKAQVEASGIQAIDDLARSLGIEPICNAYPDLRQVVLRSIDVRNAKGRGYLISRSVIDTTDMPQ